MLIHRVAILLLALALPAHCATLFVSKSGDGTTGQSWQTAFPTIAEGIASASHGDVIWIRRGTYQEHLVLVKSLDLIGGFVGDEDRVEEVTGDEGLSVIDGNYEDRVISIGRVECHLKRITITHGLETYGAGLLAAESTLGMTDCIVEENGKTESGALTDAGGGMYILASNMNMERVIIRNNRAQAGGGGIAVLDSSIHMVECVVTDNYGYQGSGIGLAGIESRGRIESTLFEGNLSTNKKKSLESKQIPEQLGADLFSSSSVLVKDCVFREARSAVSLYLHAEVYKDASGEILQAAEISFKNCTFDLPDYYPSCVWRIDPVGIPPLFENCILRGSSPFFRRYVLPNPLDSEPTVRYSDILGGYPGEGNIDSDPRFVDAENGDLHLERGSPCIDSGTGTLVTTDFDGKPRPIGRYDMGAFEFPYLRSDINVDGAVDAMDLLIFQEDWGLVSQP